MKFHDFSPFYRSGEGIRSKVSGDRLIDNPAVADAIGGSGASFEFPTSASYLSVGDDSDLDLVGPLSMSCWFKCDDVTHAGHSSLNRYYLVEKNARVYGLILVGTEIKGVLDGTTEFPATGVTVEVGRWYHVMMSYDKANVNMYVDGVLRSTTAHTAAVPISTYSLMIGEHFIGQISQVRIHNRALSADEVRASYNGQAVGYEYVGAKQDELVTGWTNHGGYGFDGGFVSSGTNITEADNDTSIGIAYSSVSLVAGKKYRAKFTIGGTAGDTNFQSGTSITIGDANLQDLTAGGAFDFDFVATSGHTHIGFRTLAGTSDFTVSNFSLVQIGCVAEFLPSGINATQWVDTSGNNLHGSTSTATAVNHTTGALTLENVTTTAMNFTGTPDASSTLDAYETGTWTAVLKDSGDTALTMNSNYDNGTYTRIGNVVHVTVYVKSTSLNGASANMELHGLPYKTQAYVGSAVANYFAFTCECGALNITAGESVTATLTQDSQKLRLRVWNSTGGVTSMTTAEWSDDGEMQISGFYFV